MECYCGKLGSRVNSRLHPYVTLAMYLRRSAQLSQLKASYTRVWEHLASERIEGALTGTEMLYQDCE
jgi:hypothetical protein